jgi:hypothetical protein
MPNLADKWREEAQILRRRRAVSLAELLEDCASELEADQRQRELEVLSLEQAAFESGYTYSALQKMVADGKVENFGKKGSPRIRRADLPRKARKETADFATDILNRQAG